MWPGAALVALALLLQGCGGGGAPANPPPLAVSRPTAQSSPIATSTPPNLVSPAPASEGKAFPMLGVEIKGETMPIENGQRVVLGDGWSAEILVAPFPPTPETDLHLFLFRGETPVKGSEMRVIYDMIDMDHGAIDRKIGREVEVGHYAVFLDMFMYGDWAADVIISHPQFDYTLKVLFAVRPWKKGGQ